jgi:hypothetical protein
MDDHAARSDRMTRPRWVTAAGLTLLVTAGAAAALRAGPGEPAAAIGTAQALPPSVERQFNMRHHFAEVAEIHDAIIRGDLPAVGRPATELSRMPVPPGTLAIGVPFVVAISDQARTVLVAADLEAAATATARMLQQCGECHRTARVAPLRPAPPVPEVGGLAGHMLEHQRAVDELLQGLVVPSASQWNRGAERLRTAPLSQADLPAGSGLAGSVRRADERVHQIAARAAKATMPSTRSGVYADLQTTCAECHSLHRRIWGPRSQ